MCISLRFSIALLCLTACTLWGVAGDEASGVTIVSKNRDWQETPTEVNATARHDSAIQIFQNVQSISCEGNYPGHLQGVCTDDRGGLYWSWTDSLAKTEANGHVLQTIKVAKHHGDLCYHDGKIFVAVNLGRFNLPAGQANSWVYTYDARTLKELARHPVSDVVHGAGGIAFHDGKFIVVGGLPEGICENYLYEYDVNFHFRQRHVLRSGYTKMGIQTAAYAEGAWWFGCYGKPAKLLRADEAFRLNGQWEFDAALGITGVGEGRFLIGQNAGNKQNGYNGRIVAARADNKKGLLLKNSNGNDVNSRVFTQSSPPNLHHLNHSPDTSPGY